MNPSFSYRGDAMALPVNRWWSVGERRSLEFATESALQLVFDCAVEQCLPDDVMEIAFIARNERPTWPTPHVRALRPPASVNAQEMLGVGPGSATVQVWLRVDRKVAAPSHPRAVGRTDDRAAVVIASWALSSMVI